MSEEAKVPYLQANREVRTKMKEAKELWIKEQCDAIERGFEKGQSKRAYDTLKVLTKPAKSPSDRRQRWQATDRQRGRPEEVDRVLQRPLQLRASSRHLTAAC